MMEYIEIEKLKEFIENNWHSDDNEKRNERIIYASELLEFIEQAKD